MSAVYSGVETKEEDIMVFDLMIFTAQVEISLLGNQGLSVEHNNNSRIVCCDWLATR